MLSFELFNKYITNLKILKEYQLKIDDLSKPLINKNLLFDYPNLSYTALEDNFIEVLSFAMEIDPNKDDILSYWVYELNFGKDYKLGMVEDNSIKKIPNLKTVKGIYNYMIHVSKELNKNKE